LTPAIAGDYAPPLLHPEAFVSRPYLHPVTSWAAPVALGVAAFLLVAFFGTGLPMFNAGIRLAAQILFAVPLAVWACLRLRGPSETLDWAILGALALALVVAIVSLDQTGSLEAFGLSIAFALLFWLMRDLAGRPRGRAAVAVGVTAAITLWLVIAASTWLDHDIHWISLGGGLPNLESGPISGWGSANTLPILVLVGLPFLLEVPQALVRLVLGVPYLAAAVVAIPLSLGRAAYLGMLVAAVAYELLRGAPLLRRAIGAAPRARRLLVPAGAAAALVMIAITELVATRAWGLILAVMASRWRLWEEAASIFIHRPLTGGGPSTYHWLRLESAPDYADRVTVYLTHNVLMQALADGGLLLIAALGLVLGTYTWTVVRRLAPLERRQRVALAVLIGFAAASLFEDQSIYNAVTAMVVTLAAWVVGTRPTASRCGPRWVMPISIALLAAASLPAVVSIDVARTNAAAARQDELAGNWRAAADRFRIAIAAHPIDAGYQLGLGLALAHLADRDAAVSAYEAARKLAIGDPRPYGALATLTPAARERARLLDLAARRTIRDPQYAYRLGGVLMELGDLDGATNAYALAVAVDSRLFGALPAGVDRSAVAQAVERTVRRFQDQADVIGPSVNDDVALALGELRPEAPPAWQAVAAAAGGRLRDAERFAAAALGDDPHAALPHRAAAYVAAMRCDTAGLAKLRELLELIPMYATLHAGRVAEAWDDAYREQGLGDYQPLEPGTMPALGDWPIPLVAAPPRCG
jgi:tetratricopeptide (TPR) repeat protein